MQKELYENDAIRPRGIRRMFNQRFVQTMEAFGYTLCALIGLGLIYSIWTKVDVVVPCEGTLNVPTALVSASEPLAVAGWHAQPAQKIEQGAPLCDIVVAPDAQRKAHGRILLEAAAKALTETTDAQAQAALAQTQAALSSLTQREISQTLTAPAAGIVIPTRSALLAEPLERDDLIARVMDISTFEMKGNVVGDQGKKIEVGNPATVTDPISGESIQGKVIQVDRKDNAAHVTLQFAPVPEKTQQEFIKNALEPENAPALTTSKTSIVVDQQTLFRSVFGRR